MLGPFRLKNVCGVCARRKVKCDRFIPCGTCKSRGLATECLDSYASSEKQDISCGLIEDLKSKSDICSALKFWHSYEVNVVELGLYKVAASKDAGVQRNLEQAAYQIEISRVVLKLEISYGLLNFAVERLGPLFFGCFADVGDLYKILEEYWDNEKPDIGIADPIEKWTVDDYYNQALLWAIFSLSVYYMDLEKVAKLFSLESMEILVNMKWCNSNEWTKENHQSLFEHLTMSSSYLLQSANFYSTPDVRLLQIYTILASTNFAQTHINLSNSLLVQCLNVGKIFKLDSSKILVNDTSAVQLTKLTNQKIWFRLCVSDYLQSGPFKPISFHQEINSLLIQSIFLEDQVAIDTNDSENSFDSTLWKFMSLDRDLEQYSAKNSKPLLKTLESVNKQLELLADIVIENQIDSSSNEKFEQFLCSICLNSLQWKLQRLYYIHYDMEDGLVKSIHYTKVLIALFVDNYKSNAYFNKHPLVLRIFSKIVPFYSFLKILNHSDSLKDLSLDLNEVLVSMSYILKPTIDSLLQLVERIEKMQLIWEQIRVVDTRELFKHPIFVILENDMNTFQKLINNGTKKVPKKRRHSEHFDGTIDDLDSEIYSFTFVVKEFEKQYNISEIFS